MLIPTSKIYIKINNRMNQENNSKSLILSIMFDEDEPGKPQNWGWTIGIIVFICIFNLTIFIVIRVMLDSENEFDEPLVYGELRQALTKFLGLFALSFCFGCWCCFCCMGNCFKWATCCFHENTRQNCANCWSSFIKNQHNVVEQVHKKSSNIFVAHRRDKVSTQPSEIDFESAAQLQKNTSAQNKPYVRFDINEQQSDESNQREEKSPRQRPTNFGRDLQAHRKSNQWMEIHKIGTEHPLNLPTRHMKIHHDPVRRHSVAIGSHMHGRNPGSIGVHNIHYYEIPVSLMTPNAVAIVDPAFAAGTTTDSDDSNSVTNVTILSPLTSPTTPATLSPTKQEEVIVNDAKV